VLTIEAPALAEHPPDLLDQGGPVRPGHPLPSSPAGAVRLPCHRQAQAACAEAQAEYTRVIEHVPL
jgi:hypothetical protein